MACKFQGRWPDMSRDGRYGALDTYLLTVPWLTQQPDCVLHDWGGGLAYAKRWCAAGTKYVCVDGTPPADEIDDLATRVVPCDSLLLRHILENNPEDWRAILCHALESFQHRAAIVNFRPFSTSCTCVAYEDHVNDVTIPYATFVKGDIDEIVKPFLVGECSIVTSHSEHIWFLEKR